MNGGASTYSSVGTMPSSNLSGRFKDLNFSMEGGVSFPKRISFNILTKSAGIISNEKLYVRRCKPSSRCLKTCVRFIVFLIVWLHACASNANFTAWPPPVIGGNWKKSPVTMSYNIISAIRCQVEQLANLNAAKRIIMFPDDTSNLGKLLKKITINHGN